MLNRRAHSLALYAIDVTDRDARSEERVFAEVLKVSAVHWRTVNVDCGRQEEMHAFGAAVATQLGPDKFGQRRIPRRGQRNASGKRSSWSKVADAERPVGHLQSRQIKTRYIANEKAVDTSEQGKLFFERHLAKDRVGPAFNFSR